MWHPATTILKQQCCHLLEYRETVTKQLMANSAPATSKWCLVSTKWCLSKYITSQWDMTTLLLIMNLLENTFISNGYVTSQVTTLFFVIFLTNSACSGQYYL